MHSDCSKVSYYQPKNQHFFLINQQPIFCAIFFSKINPDAHFGTKINTSTFYKEDRAGGLIALRSQRNVKEMEFLRFLQQILHTVRKVISCSDVDSDLC